jgi:hypothetical protein
MLEYRAEVMKLLAEAREHADTDAVTELTAELPWADMQLELLQVRGTPPADASTEDAGGDEPAPGARHRSTRRRDDAGSLPRRPITDRTVGRELGGRYSSMFVTLTMGSYGAVHGDGSARDPKSYDYRGAAWDAIACSRLFSRWIQNLRRVVGWNVQYFAVVEPQQRGAPHLHIALRGHLTREVLRQVTEATYHQVWWPPASELRYPGTVVPVWEARRATFIDPTRTPRVNTRHRAEELLADTLTHLHHRLQHDHQTRHRRQHTPRERHRHKRETTAV